MSERFGGFDVTLPSRGLLYGDKGPKEGILRCYPMTTKEEKLIAGARGIMTDLFDSVLTSCTDLKGFPVAELLSFDRFFLLIKLRSESYGPVYRFNVTCPSCGVSNPNELNLNEDLDLKTLSPDATEPFSVKLPRSGDTIEFRLLRGKDEKAILNYQQRAIQRGVRGDASYTYRLAKHVISVNGNPFTEVLKALEYVEGMIGADSQAFQEMIEDVEAGYDTEFSMNCGNCNEYIERFMPFSANFFRPREGRNKEN